MKKIIILAVFALALASCQNEINIDVNPVTEKVHMTAGAGFLQTKSAVVVDGKNRSLAFTAGDQLYVRGELIEPYPQKIVSGYLDIEGTPAEGATSANFSGELSIYVYNSEENQFDASSHVFADPSNPFAECTNIVGILVPKDAVGFTLDIGKNGHFTNKTAATVSDLMSKQLFVYGFYDEGAFPLSTGDDDDHCTPIFNCSVEDLSADTAYQLSYINGFSRNNLDVIQALGSVTSDATGAAAFACYVSEATTASEYHALRFTNTADPSDYKIVELGYNALRSKVYNVEREVSFSSLESPLYSVSAEDVGKVIARNGKIYTNVSAASAESATAIAMIAYVGKRDGVCEHGLAVSLEDIYDYNCTFAETVGDWGVYYWAVTNSILGGSWELPTFEQWQLMLWDYYAEDPAVTDISGFCTKLTAAGGVALGSGSACYYWSNTDGSDEDHAKCLYFDGSKWSSFMDTDKTAYCPIRACFAF